MLPCNWALPGHFKVFKRNLSTASAACGLLDSSSVQHPLIVSAQTCTSYVGQGSCCRILTSWRLLRALPWRRVKKGAVLVIELGGEIPDQKAGSFQPPTTMPQLTQALVKAAYDPRCSVLSVS